MGSIATFVIATLMFFYSDNLKFVIWFKISGVGFSSLQTRCNLFITEIEHVQERVTVCIWYHS